MASSRTCCLVTAQDGRAQRWARWLRAEGWRVQTAATLSDFKPAGSSASVSVALVDFSLVRRQPAQTLTRLRAGAHSWYFALVAESSDAFGAGLGEALGSGADDVLTDNLDAAGLLKRLDAIAKSSDGLLSLPDGRLKLDRFRRQAWACLSKTRALKLTPTEFELLSMLLERRGRVATRRELIDRVWPGEDVNFETVDRHIGSLRRKLASLGKRVKTAHGEGYAVA